MRLPVLLGLLATLLVAPAIAGNLVVAPTRIDLSAAQPAGAVRLENQAAEPVLVQVETFAWTGEPTGAGLTATRALLAVPPVFSLEPGGTQIIRVALRQPPDPAREAAYRLLITEVPPDGPAGGVQFALRLSLPVFAAPPGAAPRPAWSLRTEGAGTRLEVANLGNAHLQVRRLELHAGSRSLVLDQPTYVLAGAQHGWTLDLLPPATPLTLDADTSLGKVTEQLPPPGR